MAQANIKAVITAEDRASRVLAGFGGAVENTSRQVGRVMKRAVLAFTAAGTAATLFALKSAADFEQTRVGLENMLGSADKAGDLLERISKFAAETPFEFPELAQATRQLVAFGFSAEDAFNTMTQLGDVSAAIGAPINDLAYLMGTLKVQGRAFMIDIRQFAQRGVPIYEYLAKVLKTNTKEISKMIEEGKIGFPQVQKAIQLMTKEGEIFHDTTAKQSKTLTGLMSTLRDEISATARKIVGINERGDVRKGSIFDRLRNSAQSLIDYLNENSEVIAARVEAFATKFIEGGEKMIKNFSEAIGSKGAGQAITDGFFNMLNNIDWGRVAERAIAFLVNTVPKIILGFIEGIINFARKNPMDFALFFLSLGFLPARILGALGSVLARIPLVGPLISWIFRALSGVAKWFLAPVTKLFGGIITAIKGVLAKGLGSLGGVINKALGGVPGKLAAPFRAGYRAIAGIVAGILFLMGKVEAKTSKLRHIKETPGFGGTSNERGFASGGSVSASRAITVGEHGPELFVPNSAGRIIKNSQTGGGTINLNVNIGLYAGSEMEKRKVAEALMKAWQDVQSSRNMAWSQ